MCRTYSTHVATKNCSTQISGFARSCTSSQSRAPSRSRTRRRSAIARRNRASHAGETRYSIAMRIGPVRAVAGIAMRGSRQLSSGSRPAPRSPEAGDDVRRRDTPRLRGRPRPAKFLCSRAPRSSRTTSCPRSCRQTPSSGKSQARAPRPNGELQAAPLH